MDSPMPVEKYKGELNIGELNINCAVLDDGTRIFYQRSFSEYIGYRGTSTYWQKKKDGDIVVPEFISLGKLEPYISEELKSMLYVMYESNGKQKEGIDASMIPDICDVWIKARNDYILNEKQVEVAKQCQKLISAFAKIGVIALVDEATGYQYDRERNELQKILSAYISEELLPRQKRFPDSYYKELFRLNGWDFTVKGIKKRPGVVGKRTNTLIYKQLPPGVLDELKNKTPTSEEGNRTARLHQSLSEDVGTKHLQDQITEIITLFRLSDTMKDLWMRFDKLNQRKAGQLELPFRFDNDGHTVEPIEELNMSEFNKKLKTGLDYNPRE